MHYLLISDYYFPSVKSGAIIIGDLAEHIAEQGHLVTVITFNEAQDKKVQTHSANNITVVSLRSKWRDRNRILRAISECFYSFQIKKILKQDNKWQYDYCICYSPSIFYGAALKFIRETCKAPIYLIVRDIFPKWALDAGVLKKNIIFYFFKYIEKQLYQNADFVGIESKNDLEYFYAYKTPDSVEVLDNWGSKLDIKNIPCTLDTQKKKIQIIYGGNIGDAQDLLNLIRGIDFNAIEGLAELTIMGSGNQLQLIREYGQEHCISNLCVLDQVPRKEYLQHLKAADIGLVSLNSKLKSNNFPLKMMGYLQLGLPILASVNPGNEIIELIQEQKIGAVAIAGNHLDFNQKLIYLLSDLKKLQVYKENSLSLFEERFTVAASLNQINKRFNA